MSQYNNKTYHVDFDAVAQFKFAKLLSSSKCLCSCLRLNEALSIGDKEAQQRSSQIIEHYLKVNTATAFILAVLAANGGYVQSPEVLAQKIGMGMEATLASLERMFEAGLINQLEDTSSIILSCKAIKMLQYDNTYEKLPQNEFIDILRSDSDSEDPYAEGIIGYISRRVKEYIAENPKSRIGRFYEENGMSELSLNEFNQFVLLCRHFVLDFTIGCKADRSNPAVKTMINRGWAILYAAQGDLDSDLIKQNNMLLSVNVCKSLFSGIESIIDFTSIMGQTRILKWNEIEEKTLFYNEEEAVGIQRLYQITREDEYQRITAALKEHHLKVAVSGILYGGPGTGKTELAKQIARSTQRNLLVVDASKLTGSFVGESERNYRDLFRNFRYIEAVSSRAPIMFIDEADGILGKRIDGAGNSRDRYVNTIQNIILEELNDFEGILLATTNLASNLDDAMDRRFLVKIEFHIPNENTRRKIWKAKLPQVADKDLNVIAREFSFSGGHIDNVATQAIIESIMNGSNTVTLDSLIKLCKDETSFTNKDNPRRIGF